MKTKCKFVVALDSNRCVCELPLVNFGNRCVVPRMMGGSGP
jgi:hypothetical protein